MGLKSRNNPVVIGGRSMPTHARMFAMDVAPSGTLPLTGVGGMFTRIAAYGDLVSSINVQRGSDSPDLTNDINSQYQTTDQNVVTNLYNFLSSYQLASGNFGPNIRTMAQSTIIQMVNDVQPQPSPTLQTAMAYLIAQMKANFNTVQSNHVEGTILESPSNMGNPILVCSLRDATGLMLEYSFSEQIIGTCTNDSYTSASLAGSEPVLFQGQPSVSDMLSWLYPAGSGSSIAISAINPMVSSGSSVAVSVSGITSASGSNWTSNGSMESWKNGVPVGWHIVTGTPGATIFQTTASDTFYDGLSALAFAGIGTENTEIRQKFTTTLSSGDMSQILYPYIQLAFNLFLLVSVETGYGLGAYGSGYYSGGIPYGSDGFGDGGYSAGSAGGPPSGVLQVAMTDGTDVINDSTGIPNLLTIDVSTLGSGWNSAAWGFRTPATLPTAVYFDLTMTTPLSSGSTLYIDRVGMARMAQIYPGGPFISIFSADQNMAKGDSFTITVSNDYDGKLQSLYDQLFNMRQLGLILPSSNTPTIPDS
jgi:hypothetical protein